MIKLVTVHGMISETCRKAIITGLEKLPGVEKVTVKLPIRLVEVEFEEKSVDLEKIKKCIQELGYDPM
jgi:copper chaperone CopZ